MSPPQFSIPDDWRFRASLVRTRVRKVFDDCFDPQAARFYADLVARGYHQISLIDVLPRERILYLGIPKCASTTIKMALATMIGRVPRSSELVHLRRYTALRSPVQVGASIFYRLAKDEKALRFSFVRNPYDRLVSAWAEKIQDKPLVSGDPFVEAYLRKREAMGLVLPEGADQTLSFADFVHYVAATAAESPVNVHWRSQALLLDIPGISFDFIGKLENFGQDFARVIEHVGAVPALTTVFDAHFNKSRRKDWRDYYSDALADQVYRIYERDFDYLGYPRAI